MKVYQEIAQKLAAINNCAKSNNIEWFHKHNDSLDEIIKQHMPHGSGFDSGTKLTDKSTPEKLIFEIGYHHMDENGFYDGWSELKVIVKPSMVYDIDIKITGLRRKNRYDMDYMFETIEYCLTREVTP